MKKLFFVALFSCTASSFGTDSCFKRTDVIGDLNQDCASLEHRCPGEEAGSGSRSCPGESVEFRVVYASVCGPDRDQTCGTAYNDWTTINHNCFCNEKHRSTVVQNCVKRHRVDNDAYISTEECVAY